MSDVERFIMADVENEPGIDAGKIGLEIKRGKGLLNRRKVLHIFGTVDSEEAKRRVQRIAEKQVGDRYDLSNDLKVKEQ